MCVWCVPTGLIRCVTSLVETGERVLPFIQSFAHLEKFGGGLRVGILELDCE